MHAPIEDYALIGDCHTAALVSRSGSIDWLCLPRFDSPAVFSALLGTEEHGRWLLAPAGEVRSVQRSYVGDSFVLSTRYEVDGGSVEVVDAMPLRDRRADVIRRVRGVSGTVRMRQEYVVRFGYGDVLPWVLRVPEEERALLACAGPDAVLLRTDVPLPRPQGNRHVGEFDVRAGEVVDLVMTWYPSHRPAPPPLDRDRRLAETVRWWQDWADRREDGGPFAAAVARSLLVLRALTHEDTGGIVAAATTSLPEEPGGVRNWDYRYCWLRDAALTLETLISHGYSEEAREWRDWLLRAVAGDPEDVQIMYGVAGERHLPERELGHLPGYEGSRPVRVGNGAFTQYQADVIGEVLVALDAARRDGIAEDPFSWPLQRALLDFVERNWDRADSGIWEMRGPEQHFTHSRVMVWAALDRGVRAVRSFGLDGPVDRWQALRDRVRDEVLQRGVDPQRGCFTQRYGSREVDASLLVLPQVGFVAPDDPVMLATVRAIEEDLLQDGLVLRYRTHAAPDGLPPGEHPFLACSFWLAEQYALSGRVEDARALLERLVSLCNDVGLLSEEYDTTARRQLGNTPQALSHLALVRAVQALRCADPQRLLR
ncbi:Glucoamylase (glucan-1,4-alpha-glucosidase), GH15 family [Quadrisphaera sp. DSM 44207]|nr:glycoside hydrolase family 15 protein [Quadrisphaera sp. DSM 44207]SDQ44755.1 Glucoamylase (glucan-1,4-alpha-glucosidase), GH15 family [Quadrisphaera sp. DSM 44207]